MSKMIVRIKDMAQEPQEFPDKKEVYKNAFFIVVIALLVIAAVVVLANPKKPVVYICQVDTVSLGPQLADYCSLIPESIKKRINVYIVGGFAKTATILTLKKVPNTLYINVLTTGEQVTMVVNTPRTILAIKRYGFFGELGALLVLVLFLYLSFRIGKWAWKKRKSETLPNENQAKVQPGKRELNFVG